MKGITVNRPATGTEHSLFTSILIVADLTWVLVTRDLKFGEWFSSRFPSNTVCALSCGHQELRVWRKVIELRERRSGAKNISEGLKMSTRVCEFREETEKDDEVISISVISLKLLLNITTIISFSEEEEEDKREGGRVGERYRWNLGNRKGRDGERD